MATEHTVGFEPADRLAQDRESVRRDAGRRGAGVRGPSDVDPVQHQRQREHHVCRQHADGVSGRGGRDARRRGTRRRSRPVPTTRSTTTPTTCSTSTPRRVHGGRRRVVRLLLGGPPAAVDGDGVVRGAVLGRGYERRRESERCRSADAREQEPGRSSASQGPVPTPRSRRRSSTSLRAGQPATARSPTSPRRCSAAGAGTYSVANVQAGTGGDRYAGWTLVVAYEDLTQPPRNLTVDDGFITVSSGASR